jgi:hypothetical protein
MGGECLAMALTIVSSERPRRLAPSPITNREIRNHDAPCRDPTANPIVALAGAGPWAKRADRIQRTGRTPYTDRATGLLRG